ncbi:MAG: DUF5664 domain-containing protein [Azoarcus sp.]|nr:DUF5664 domain-containing protein [Azoarcus sp.]
MQPAETPHNELFSETNDCHAGKPRFDLLPPNALMDIATVMTEAAASGKYGLREWEEGRPWGTHYAALQRHLQAFWAGQDLDEESALPHLAHAGFRILALLEYMRTHPELDDRP